MKYIFVLFLITLATDPSLPANKDFNELILKSTKELIQHSLTELNAKRETAFHAITKINSESIKIESGLKYTMNVSVVKIRTGFESICFIELLNRNKFDGSTDNTAIFNVPLEKRQITTSYRLHSKAADINDNQTAEVAVADLLTKLTDHNRDPEYRLLKLNSFTSENIYRTRHEINADIKDVINNIVRSCKITIVDETWKAERIRATIDCPGEEKLYWGHGLQFSVFSFNHYDFLIT